MLNYRERKMEPRIVITEKQHKCAYCGKTIEKESKAYLWKQVLPLAEENKRAKFKHVKVWMHRECEIEENSELE
jgi:hypothetical protein